MAVNKRTIRISKDIRVTILGHTEDVTRKLVEAWARAWDELEGQWRVVLAELIAEAEDGQWPSRRTIRRAQRVQEALQVTHAQILGLTDLGGVLVTESTRKLLEQEEYWQEQLVRSQLPPAANTATGGIVFNRVDEDALGAILERTTENIESLAKPLADDAVDAMKRSLYRGIALGENPKVAAGRMLKLVEGRFNGGLTRAMNIARTEMLDAQRSGAAASQFANQDILDGWIWDAQLDTRACPSCWSQHGSEHQLQEIGPIDHHQGRCARLPKTKSWRDLGFDIDEPASLLPDSQSVFNTLPREDQLTIMGPVRLQALQTDALRWNELSVRSTNAGWRDSFVPIPVRATRMTLVRGLG